MKRLLLIVGVLLVAGCGASATGAPASSGAPTASSPPAPPAPIVKPVRVDIPALHVTDELVTVGLAPDRSMEVPPVDVVGFYELARLPGEVGPAVLAGHVNYDGVQGSFARIGQLKRGDDVMVTGDDGRALTFDVYEVREFPKAAPDWGFVFGDRARPELVLVTCSGDVVNHNYTHNTAVAARLVMP